MLKWYIETVFCNAFIFQTFLFLSFSCPACMSVIWMPSLLLLCNFIFVCQCSKIYVVSFSFFLSFSFFFPLTGRDRQRGREICRRRFEVFLLQHVCSLLLSTNGNMYWYECMIANAMGGLACLHLHAIAEKFFFWQVGYKRMLATSWEASRSKSFRSRGCSLWFFGEGGDKRKMYFLDASFLDPCYCICCLPLPTPVLALLAMLPYAHALLYKMLTLVYTI